MLHLFYKKNWMWIRIFFGGTSIKGQGFFINNHPGEMTKEDLLPLIFLPFVKGYP